MKIIYRNQKVRRICEDHKLATIKLGKDVADKLYDLLNAIEAFINLYDLFCLPQYRLHSLNGEREYQYSFVIHKGTKWRLVVYPLDRDGNILTDKSNEKEMLIKAIIVEIWEVSEHYA